MTKPYDIGIAFGSGAARGIAHIGAIKAFEENGIKADIISGTSAGSIVGLLYASGKSASEMMEIVKKVSVMKAYQPTWPKGGFTDMSYIKKLMSEHVEQRNFEELKTPIKVVVTNMNTGLVEIMETGPWLEPVAASCSIPFAFKPVIINDQTYVDGGLVMNLPTQPLRDICNTVIAINVLPNVKLQQSQVSGWRNTAMRFGAVVVLSNTLESIKFADVFIEPRRLAYYPLFDVKQAEEMCMLGYEETIKLMPEIKEKIAQNRVAG